MTLKVEFLVLYIFAVIVFTSLVSLSFGISKSCAVVAGLMIGTATPSSVVFKMTRYICYIKIFTKLKDKNSGNFITVPHKRFAQMTVT